MKQVANKHNVELREGVYCGLGNEKIFLIFEVLQIHILPLGGPCYETIAEINMLRLLGADSVGKRTEKFSL